MKSFLSLSPRKDSSIRIRHLLLGITVISSVCSVGVCLAAAVIVDSPPWNPRRFVQPGQTAQDGAGALNACDLVKTYALGSTDRTSSSHLVIQALALSGKNEGDQILGDFYAGEILPCLKDAPLPGGTRSPILAKSSHGYKSLACRDRDELGRTVLSALTLHRRTPFSANLDTLIRYLAENMSGRIDTAVSNQALLALGTQCENSNEVLKFLTEKIRTAGVSTNSVAPDPANLETNAESSIRFFNAMTNCAPNSASRFLDSPLNKLSSARLVEFDRVRMGYLRTIHAKAGSDIARLGDHSRNAYLEAFGRANAGLMNPLLQGTTAVALDGLATLFLDERSRLGVSAAATVDIIRAVKRSEKMLLTGASPRLLPRFRTARRLLCSRSDASGAIRNACEEL